MYPSIQQRPQFLMCLCIRDWNIYRLHHVSVNTLYRLQYESVHISYTTICIVSFHTVKNTICIRPYSKEYKMYPFIHQRLKYVSSIHQRLQYVSDHTLETTICIRPYIRDYYMYSSIQQRLIQYEYIHTLQTTI